MKLKEIGDKQQTLKVNNFHQNSVAYEYLCRIEEVKLWMESILNEPLPPTILIEENLRNGVYLAKIGNFIAPERVPLSRIYDIFQHKYKSVGLQPQHAENVSYWVKALKSINLPKKFIVEAAGIYDKKDMPQVIYCIHALSIYLFHLGQAPLIQELYGKVQFTENDIDTISFDMEKNNVSLPEFQKINDLLAECLTNDKNTLNIEINNLNQAIIEESNEKLLSSLNLTSANLVQIIPEYISYYLKAFKNARNKKFQSAQNQSLNRKCKSNSYNITLSLSEIQGYIREVNIECTWRDILLSVKKRDRHNLKKIIESFFPEIKDYQSKNLEYYINEALSIDPNIASTNKAREKIHGIVRNGNRKFKEFSRVSDAVKKVEEAIKSNSKDNLLTALKIPCLKLSSEIINFAAPLYLEEMREDLKMSKELTYKDIKSSIFILNNIAKITVAVDNCDYKSFWMLLWNADIPFMNIDIALKTQYFKALSACREQKKNQNLENTLLTFVDIQECIDMANIQTLEQTNTLIYLEEINNAVQCSNTQKLLPALQGVTSEEELSDDDAILCMHLLKKLMKEEEMNEDRELWLNDVISVVDEMKDLKKKALFICDFLRGKNLRDCLPPNTFETNQKSKNKFLTTNGYKNIEKNNSSDIWLKVKLKDEINIYLNPSSGSIKWFPTVDFIKKLPCLIPINDIEVLFRKNYLKLIFTNGCDWKFSNFIIILQFIIRNFESTSFKRTSLENFHFDSEILIKFQGAIRGFIIRKNIKKKLKAIILIQKWWRRIQNEKLIEAQIGKNEKKFSSPDDFYIKHVRKIIKIQAFWRGYLTRKNFNSHNKILDSKIEPSFKYLRRLSLLNYLNDHYDYSVELEIQKIKSSIVKIIRTNQEQAKKLEEMDIKIGLLVQNRMSVEAIVAENKKIQNISTVGIDSRGIKAFSKEAKTLLDGYRQLFYLLQTDPVYLTRLIVRLPSKFNHVIQSCVLSLFNYGSNTRDAYLLLRLFRLALFEEVQNKFQKPVDAITGNSLVLRLAVAFTRQNHNPLKNILGFLIEKVLNDKVCIDTNPVDIYRRWVNQIETESGKPSNLPQTVSIEEALSYPEIVMRLNHNLKILQSWVKCFLDRLVQCVNQFPYALRFIAKQLKNALFQKFPKALEKDILKIVGNLVYYQYINSAIVAPDAFCTITLPPDQPMKQEQRRNLASIAKILHFAATKKGFGEETKYLKSLNPFIIECHEIMKQFCKNCCAVEELEKHFRIDKYSEALMINKPKIYINLEEIRECHKLLLEVQHEIAPDSMDPIHEILDDLGSPPSLSTLVGCNDSSEATLCRAGRLQVCLELENKFQIPPQEVTENEKLFIEQGDTLASAICVPKHFDLYSKLAKLELAGFVRSENDYIEIIKSLLIDISYKQEFLKLQKQEIIELKSTLLRLEEKKEFYESQVSRYEQYLKTCLSNLTVSSKRYKEKKEYSIKYSGARLREKGVLISLNGVPLTQLKNVQFEISTTKLNGIYSVHGRFMGVEVCISKTSLNDENKN
ncbi:ras GTP-ase activating protein with iq motif, putative [Pediculus humanus corporis]|uniref:Ras GTP-ase activating protein with iq motif, putative n=1 Tax=Pediculus humanus subsp. corporis TaxID=121224 RepID=E0VGB8_PEDHC|nr:ras GTP-ase activating protein with iq motif, putative [Pediculus humanus corporis]EEB12424.1 ras GTP-ase activating protein with iq motif, putative [Pediculus humanus corporis]